LKPAILRHSQNSGAPRTQALPELRRSQNPSRTMYNPGMDTLLHICARTDWQAALAQGEYRAESLAAEGFTHCSTPAQVAATANRFYHGRRGLVLLTIDRGRVQAEVRWEPADGSLFPHVYGTLPLDAVVDVRDFAPGADGTFSWPV